MCLWEDMTYLMGWHLCQSSCRSGPEEIRGGLTMNEILHTSALEMAIYIAAVIFATGPSLVVGKLTLLPKTLGADFIRTGC